MVGSINCLIINCFLKTISIEENIESKSIKNFFSFLSSIRIGYMFFLKKPFAHVGIYPLANDIFAVLDCFCFCSQSLLHCKKKNEKLMHVQKLYRV